MSFDNGNFIGIATEAGTFIVQGIEYDEVKIFPYEFILGVQNLVISF